ncbi:MAG TPA: YggT family protein [Candidatus Cloacimonadota bacterium]|nr:YggT family protein [Candidatus Cloacimonadota bacterium]HOV17138.1 YggT family protein [Candidatus Cloacimonadota bacterium]HQL15408.1 YggT family protein [Candidatus Cloacimonadota bacterium]
MNFIILVLVRLLDIYSLLILIRALMSWFSVGYRNRFYLWLIRITEPVLAPLRRLIPLPGIDISPIIAILLIDLVIKRILIALLHPFI